MVNLLLWDRNYETYDWYIRKGGILVSSLYVLQNWFFLIALFY